MPSSIEKTVDGFPFPTIDPIIGTPDYESIANIHLNLNYNAATVQSNLGCGTLGFLYLTVSPAVYATLSTTTFVLPVNPGPKPIIPTGSTGTVISDLRYHHTKATKIFIEYEHTYKALCHLLLASTDKLYVWSLCHNYIGYGKTTTRALLDHLYSKYANISASALQDNGKRLRAPYDSNQPFDTLIDQVENAVDYASAGETTYTPAQVVVKNSSLKHELESDSEQPGLGCMAFPLRKRSQQHFRPDRSGSRTSGFCRREHGASCRCLGERRQKC